MIKNTIKTAIKTGLVALSFCPISAATAAEVSERLPGNQDSLAAFAFLIIAVLIGAGFSAQSSAPRKASLWATALVLLVGAGLLSTAMQAGYVGDPLKPQTPLDHIKMLILMAFMLTGIVGALFLAFVASRPEKPQTTEIASYDQVSRFLHWAAAVMVLSLFAEGLYMAGLPHDAPIRLPLYVIHKSIGFTVFSLVIVR